MNKRNILTHPAKGKTKVSYNIFIKNITKSLSWEEAKDMQLKQ